MINISDIRLLLEEPHRFDAADIELFDALMNYREQCLTLPKEEWGGVVELMCTVYPNAQRVLNHVYMNVPTSLLYLPRGALASQEDMDNYDEWFAYVLWLNMNEPT